MVYYFTSSVVEPSGFIYVGKDKFENEDLIKFGWEEDVCLPPANARPQFHADKLSSAHIYLRMREGQSWDALPEDLVADLAQLTKANSIEGNKKDNVTVIYTPWSNLKKDGSMDVGQVGFKDPRKVASARPPGISSSSRSESLTHRQVKRVLVAQRENAIVNRLNKTRVEKKPDLKLERDERLKDLRRRDQAAQQSRRKEEAKQAQEWKEKKWQKDHAYDDLFTEENMAAASNQDRDANWEDDFM
ncbi:Coiled-coil domain-containing protein 25 [Tolypocladium capitatum]|uniref:Coiled-coil domain-containing protein 25 n=1 Tax=Tolypocladium capitatum TaxID=45235 RepID=A0A2K3QD28_9HYPO|nr:Coiled-coil domain-containing protein 25 [Tolypocladium capitatum]